MCLVCKTPPMPLTQQTLPMKLKSSSIFIDGLHLYAFHGVMELERNVGGEFTVSLRVHYNIEKAMETDSVDDTLNYAELCEVVRQQMAQPSALLEHVAGRIAKAVFQRFPQASALQLRLVKQNPPMGADCEGAGVELEVENDV